MLQKINAKKSKKKKKKKKRTPWLRLRRRKMEKKPGHEPLALPSALHCQSKPLMSGRKNPAGHNQGSRKEWRAVDGSPGGRGGGGETQPRSPTFQGIVLDKFWNQTWARMTGVKDKSQQWAANSFAFYPFLPSSLPSFLPSTLSS